MRAAASLRLATRLARREVRRRPGRTALVALLVAVPVAGMTVVGAFVRTDNFDADAEWTAYWGSATDLALSGGAVKPPAPGDEGPDLKAAVDALPPGSKVLSWHNAYVVFRTTERDRAQGEILDVPLGDGRGRDLVQLMNGRLPAAAGEVFLTRSLARDLDVRVGDMLDLERPDRVSWRVVGLGERRTYWGAHSALLGPATPFPWEGPVDFGAGVNYAVDLPEGVTARQVRSLVARFGPEVLAPRLRAVVPTSPSRTEAMAWTWVVGAIVLTVVGIVVASAFAAGARRQLTTLGQLAANGASPAVLRRVLFLQGTWTGVLGSVVGLALGGVGLVVLAPHADALLRRDVDPWVVRLADLVPVFLLGVAAATVAAMIPARTTARIPVLAALAGRRPLPRVPRWLTAVGGVAAVAGLALLGLAVLGGQAATHDTALWGLTAIVGGMCVLFGACAMTPAYASVLEPLASRVGGAWRLAARSLARQRTRTSAVVSGVCAASALAVGAGAMVVSIDAREAEGRAEMRPDEVHVSAEITTMHGDRARPEFASTPAPAPTELVSSLRAVARGSEVLELRAVQPPEGLRWTLSLPEDSGSSREDASIAYGPGSEGAAVVDATGERVYELRAQHREALARDGLLVLGASDTLGEIVVVPADSPEAFPPGAGMGRGVTLGGSVAQPTAGAAPVPSATGGARHPVTVVDGRGYGVGALPRLLVLPAAVERLGFVNRPPITVVRAPKAYTREQVTAVEGIIDDYRLDTTSPVMAQSQLNVFTESRHPADGPDPLLLQVLLTGTALLFSLFVVAVSLALAAAETRDERDVLTVAGAPPSTMWTTSARKAALLTGLGTVLAVPVGFLPVVVSVLASDPAPPLVFPWRLVLLLVVAMPLVAGVATGAASALALRLRPVRISTMAFD